MSRVIGIIADDLTGANDSGIQLTEKGINTSVLFDIPEKQNKLDSGIVIDTDSRSLTKEEAASVTEKAALFLKDSGYRYIYKKMDSTLRGHIGTELKAVGEVFHPDFTVIAPAFPAMGRTTVDGRHYVHGKLIAETEISKDPKHPVTESSIPQIIEREIGEKVGLLKKGDYSSDEDAFQEKLAEMNRSGIRYLVCDAVTQEDLEQAARKIAGSSYTIIWSGSAGLAEVLPDVLGISAQKEENTLPDANLVLTVCGSLSEVTQHQVKYAIQQSHVVDVEVDTNRMFSEEWRIWKQEYINDCLQGLENDYDVVVYVPSTTEVRKTVMEKGRARGMTNNQIGELISYEIGDIVSEVTKASSKLKGLVLTGGDTAKDTSRKLGAVGFRLVKQIEPGIPLATLLGAEVEYKVVTKAGAFGKEDSIYKAMNELKGVKTDGKQ